MMFLYNFYIYNSVYIAAVIVGIYRTEILLNTVLYFFTIIVNKLVNSYICFKHSPVQQTQHACCTYTNL